MYPWETAEAAWVGWIPTVSGHLSFSLIGNHADEAGHIVLNGDKPRPDGRVVLVKQHRRNKDFGYWSWIAEKVLKDTAQDYVLIGHTEAAARPEFDPRTGRLTSISDARGCLRGSIYWLPYDEDKEHRNQLRTALSDLAAESQRIGRLFEAQAQAALDEIEPWTRARFDPFVAELEAEDGTKIRRALKFEFALFRTGECRLWYDHNHVDVEALHEIARQIFYFLKAIAHAHSHHGEEADQMIHLARTKPGLHQDPKSNETGWRNETQWGLSRVFEQLHRKTGLMSQRRSLGVLAYADAFQASLSRVMRTPGEEDVFEEDVNVALYDNKHRRDSVNALIEYHSFKATVATQIYALAITILFASAGLWYGFVSIRETLCKQGGDICLELQARNSAFMISLIVDSPMTFFACSVLFAILLFNIATKDWEEPPIFERSQSHFLRPIFAISNGIVSKFNLSPAFIVILVQLTLLGFFAFSIFMIYHILQYQAEIRAFAAELTATKLLQWLP